MLKRDHASFVAFKALTDMQGTQDPLAFARRILRNLGELEVRVQKGTLQYPVLLASNITEQQYLSICEDYEYLARVLSYSHGKIYIIDALRDCHEAIIHLVSHMISTGYSVPGLGYNSIAVAGGTDIRYGGHHIVRPDNSFRPKFILGLETPTIIVQVLDSERVDHGRLQAHGLLNDPNNDIQVIINIKIWRRVRLPFPQPLFGPHIAPPQIGENVFSRPGFLGDRVPGPLEANPANEFAFIIYTRGVLLPQIIRFGFGTTAPYHADDDIAQIFGAVVPTGAVPGPIVAGIAGYSYTIPWASIYFVPGGGGPLPVGIANTLAAGGVGAGIALDAFDVLSGIDEERTRYRRYHN